MLKIKKYDKKKNSSLSLFKNDTLYHIYVESSAITFYFLIGIKLASQLDSKSGWMLPHLVSFVKETLILKFHKLNENVEHLQINKVLQINNVNFLFRWAYLQGEGSSQ